MRQLIALLEAKKLESKHKENISRESQKRFQAIFGSSLIGILITNKNMKPVQVNQTFQKMLGYTKDELRNMRFIEFTHSRDRMRSIKIFNGLINRKYDHFRLRKRFVRKDGQIVWVDLVVAGILDSKGKCQYTLVMVEDITRQMKAEEMLKKRETELKLQARSLQEVNTALKVLLNQREEDKIELEERILSAVKELIIPYIKDLRDTQLDPKQTSYLNILESNLTNIIHPFSYKLSSKFSNLTPKEIKVATFLKEQKTSKEIAELLNVSPRAIDFHRGNLRKKFGLKNKNVNLMSYLLSMKS